MSELLNKAYELCKQGTEAHREASLAELHKEFPEASATELDTAFERANKLIEIACEWAEQKRGPANDGTGHATIDLEQRCPGYSPRIYNDAESWGFYLTK